MNWWKRRDWIVVLGLLVMVHDAPAQTAPKPSFLEGDAKLACECLLCLGAGPHPPKECQVALTKYYLIQGTSPFQTLVKRRDFLQLCPKHSPLQWDHVGHGHGPVAAPEGRPTVPDSTWHGASGLGASK